MLSRWCWPHGRLAGDLKVRPSRGDGGGGSRRSTTAVTSFVGKDRSSLSARELLRGLLTATSLGWLIIVFVASGWADVATAGNKLLAVGGTNGNNTLARVEEYDPATNTWAGKASMPTARIGL